MDNEQLKIAYNITAWPKLNVNYVGITKCMNTSMKAALMEASGYDLKIDNPDHDNAFIHRGKDAEYIDKEEANRNGFKTFTIVRDPHSRAESLYLDFMIKRFDKLGIGRRLSWPEFINHICLTTDAPRTDIHIRSQHSFIKDLDDVFVIHLETYKKQKKYLEAITGKMINIPHLHTDPDPKEPLVWTQEMHDKIAARYPNDLKYIHNLGG
jgi:hypothetical protein